MEKILIVEDDGCLNASLVAALTNEYEVRAVTDGAAAVDFLDEHAVDLVLLDMVIPERDGFSVLSHIAGMAPKPRVVVLSVLTQVSKVVKTMRLGASDYLVKPCDLNKLKRVLRDTLSVRPPEQAVPLPFAPAEGG
jgi:two-component system response regulator AtoC